MGKELYTLPDILIFAVIIIITIIIIIIIKTSNDCKAMAASEGG